VRFCYCSLWVSSPIDASVTFLNFLSFDDCGPELRKKLCFAIAQFCSRQRAGYRSVIEILHGRLAGGTTPFILRYSTICP
jgi:hypothetical protein